MENFIDEIDDLVELKLLREEKKFSTLFKLSPVGMAIVDRETGKFLDVNDAVIRSTGYTKKEFLQLSYWDITPKEYEKQELQQIEDLKATGHFGPNEKEYIRENGTRYPISISGVALTDIDGRKIVLGIIEDISVQKEYEKKLKNLALYDPLTLLANRRLLSELFEQGIAQCGREQKNLAVLMIDLDGFKQVNDSLGYNIGDDLLAEVAQRIKSLAHRKTDIVARLSGDKFVILLPLVKNSEDALEIAKKVCSLLAKSFYIKENKINISSSIGISIFPEHGNTERELMEKADKALYKVKNISKNNFLLFS